MHEHLNRLITGESFRSPPGFRSPPPLSTMPSEVVIPTRPRQQRLSLLPTSTKTDRRNLPLSMPSEKPPSRLDLYLAAFPAGRPLKRPRSLFGDVTRFIFCSAGHSPCSRLSGS